MKNGNPCGRIVHDYGYHPEQSYSVNATHSCTTVRYLTTQEVVTILDSVIYFIKGDLENGFRQFGTHPVDWRFQVYSNGPREHYIDLACPFGKTNSPLEFCPPVALLAKSLATRYAEVFKVRSPVMDTRGRHLRSFQKQPKLQKSGPLQGMDVRHWEEAYTGF